MRGSIELARRELAERLRSRRGEIEQATLTRIYAISDPAEVADPTYTEGLRVAVSAALDYGLQGVEAGEERAPPVPPVLLAQARLAARSGVTLDTVLRRYFAGYALLGDFLVNEAQASGLLRDLELKRLLSAQATFLDRLLAAVSEEHAREAQSRPASSEQRRAERIERLLAGELIDTSGFGYDFERWHLGAIAAGQGAEQAIRELAEGQDCRLLSVRRGEDTVWAWLGSRRRLDPGEQLQGFAENRSSNVAVALGEPGEGLAGWRLSHRQATAALQVALRGPEKLARYAEVALLASVLRDDLLATSLRELYLAPLERERDGGGLAKETLRAYFRADRNVSSAAAVLGVRRHTVASRLRAIEQTIGRALHACSAELEAVLRLDDFGTKPGRY